MVKHIIRFTQLFHRMFFKKNLFFAHRFFLISSLTVASSLPYLFRNSKEPTKITEHNEWGRFSSEWVGEFEIWKDLSVRALHAFFFHFSSFSLNFTQKQEAYWATCNNKIKHPTRSLHTNPSLRVEKKVFLPKTFLLL